jgi:hypothetical protein
MPFSCLGSLIHLKLFACCHGRRQRVPRCDLREHIRTRLSIPDDALKDNVVAGVKASQYARDYFANEDFVRALREEDIDILWKRASRDVDSVLAAVNSLLTSSRCGALGKPAIDARRAAVQKNVASTCAHLSCSMQGLSHATATTAQQVHTELRCRQVTIVLAMASKSV